MCGLYNAQILNVETVATEAFVSRSTVEAYFGILEETLIGFKLASLQGKFNKKEVMRPKYYSFDNGVSRASANRAFEALS